MFCWLQGMSCGQLSEEKKDDEVVVCAERNMCISFRYLFPFKLIASPQL